MIRYECDYEIKQATPLSAGYDLVCQRVEAHKHKPGHTLVRCYYGVKFDIGGTGRTFGMISPRSSTKKYGLMACQTPGILDNDYQGEVFSDFFYIGTEMLDLGELVGRRLAQIVFLKNQYGITDLKQVDSVVVTTGRGTGGDGSTGE
jgi:dUTPase